ncbi:hypothetical protein BCAR13_360052 [Paraburkholderia caribensis]|nr:hypothetical protein BCAR13_360052 [Paraburkholderia caribensis]
MLAASHCKIKRDCRFLTDSSRAADTQERYKPRESLACQRVLGLGGGRPDGPLKVWERFRRVQETDTDRYVFSG